MGAKTWMLVTAKSNPKESLITNPTIDREKTSNLVRHLFTEFELTQTDDGDLYYTNPPDDEVFAGVFDDVSVVAASEFGIDYPSKLPVHYISSNGTTTLHAMHSVVDWFAFASWVDGELVRSLSLSPDDGVIEDIGDRLEFELPYWNGDFPTVEDDEDEYPFQFHPLELGEAALSHFFGYQIEGYVSNNLIDPEAFQLSHFSRKPLKRWWQVWR